MFEITISKFEVTAEEFNGEVRETGTPQKKNEYKETANDDVPDKNAAKNQFIERTVNKIMGHNKREEARIKREKRGIMKKLVITNVV